MGAEESKLSHSKHEKAKNDRYAKEDRYRYAPNSYENRYVDSWEKPPKLSDNSSGSLKRSPREKDQYEYYGTNRSKRYNEKENRNRHRRHYSDDRSSSDRRRDDKSSHRDRVRSDDRESNSRHKEKLDRKKKESPRSVLEKKTERKARKENKKRKSSPETKSQSPNRKSKTEKREKASTSCLPNVAQGRRRKKKANLEKHNRAHRSVPNLSSDDMSRVGAWLNSNTFTLPPESPAWPPAFSYSYGTLSGAFPLAPPLDGAGKPRPIVDGMGSPLGTIYPNGTFVPNSSKASIEKQDNFGSPIHFRYSMPPVYQFPYFPYYFPPHPYARQHSSALPESSSNERHSLKNRSRSHNHIDAIGNTEKIEPIYASVSKVKKKNQSNPSSSTLPRERSRIQGSASSLQSFARQSGEYYSDIQETKDSMMSYRANRPLSIDNVRHAEFGPIKTPPLSETESDSSEQDSSLSDSSFNDIELCSNEAKVSSEATKSSSLSDQAKLSSVHFFQPISSREVFFDDARATSKKQPEKPRHTLKSNDFQNSPLVRLGEQESIVATSFLIEGEKAFCLTKSKKAASDKNFSRPAKTATITIKPKIQQQLAEKQNSGTWFGLTASSTQTNSDGKSSVPTSSRPTVTSQLSSSSASSVSLRDARSQTDISASTMAKTNRSSDDKFGVSSTKSVKSPATLSLRSSSSTTQSLSTKQKSPTPKPRISSITPTPDALKAVESTSTKESKHVSVQTLGSTSKTNRSKADYYSDSSDGEPLMRDEDQRITRKLIRIDSKDSFTMKRRLKYHRRSSSLTDKFASGHEYIEGSTLPLTPRSDSYVADIETSHYSSRYVSSKAESAFSSPTEPYVDALIHRAKSEELLKRDISRSSEELLSDFSPLKKKETLQERAARILGLNSDDLYRTKKKQDSHRALLFPDLVANKIQTQPEESDITNVTASKSAQGNISHPAVDSSSISHRSNEEEPGSFAVSVTESMLKRVPVHIEIKNVETSSHSSVDISSISSDTSTKVESNDYSPVPDAEYLIEVSDSVLEDASVPCSVKPHKEVHASPAKEYKLPDNILLDSEASASTSSSFFSPLTAHASIVASYADNIYERVPAPGEISHASELSDDTTETESLDHSGRFLEMIKQKAKDSNSAPATLERTYENEPTNSLTDFGSKPKNTHPASPVPIALHSAPLTPGEIDIIKQLYNKPDDNASFSSYNSPAPARVLTARSEVDLQKEKVAKSIGMDIANLASNRSSHQDITNARLEKVEDFEIKIFPGASTVPVTASKESEENQESDNSDSLDTTDTETTETQSSSAQSNSSDVEEVMQSLGLNPNEAWFVSL